MSESEDSASSRSSSLLAAAWWKFVEPRLDDLVARIRNHRDPTLRRCEEPQGLLDGAVLLAVAEGEAPDARDPEGTCAHLVNLARRVLNKEEWPRQFGRRAKVDLDRLEARFRRQTKILHHGVLFLAMRDLGRKLNRKVVLVVLYRIRKELSWPEVAEESGLTEKEVRGRFAKGMVGLSVILGKQVI